MDYARNTLKEFSDLARENGYYIWDVCDYLGVNKNTWYRLNSGQIPCSSKLLGRCRSVINYYKKTGLFRPFYKNRQKIDYEVLRELDDRYWIENLGRWDLAVLDDPLLNQVLVYEDLEL